MKEGGSSISSSDVSPAVAQHVYGKVPENRWDLLDVPRLGSWRPLLSVSVVIPVYQAPERLRRTLAALRLQSYPRELMEVIVADDGSDPPVTLPDDWSDLDVQVQRQEHFGFGAGRARNLGAQHATGDVLLFLDADMLLEPQAVEAHLRWHHLSSDAVTLGARKHADLSDIDWRVLQDVRAQDGWQRLLDGREQWSVEWIDTYMQRSDNMTKPDDDAFRLTTGANLGVRRDFFSDIGEFSAFGIRGVEDTEIGYRLYNAGALMIWETEALGWHDGRSFFQGTSAAAAKEERQAVMADYLPVRRYRNPHLGRIYAVPGIVVHMVVYEQPAAQVVAAVEAVLGSDRHDLLVSLTRDPNGAQAARIDRHFANDPRVRVGDGTPVASDDRSPWQVWLPPEAALAPSTLSRLGEHLTAGDCGVVYATIPGLSPSSARVRAVRTRALARARRLAGSPADVDAIIGQCFGERWMAGAEIGIRALDPTGTAVPVAASPEMEVLHLPLPQALTLSQKRLQRAEQRLAKLERSLARQTKSVPQAATRPAWVALGRKGVRRLVDVRSMADARQLATSVRRRLSARNARSG